MNKNHKDLSKYYVEECTDSDPCNLNTDLQVTNTSVEMACATEVHMTRNGGYISQRSDERRERRE